MPTKVMADWKQITARIRRARTSKDPAAQLSGLYEKTRDAMVAFELAKYFESAGQNAEASKWYSSAAERFRRADWKTKAQESAVRLAAEPPVGPPKVLEPTVITKSAAADDSETAASAQSELADTTDENSRMLEAAVAVSSEAGSEAAAPDSAATDADKKRRRRGRRGGRNRRKPDGTKEAAAPAPAAAATSSTRGLPSKSFARAESPEPAPAPSSSRSTHAHALPQLPVEPMPELGAANVRGRYGDPGVSSRLTLLEMQFRRLMTCQPVQLEAADTAPVGPGVFLLTDSDLTSYYYVEACQTLRIAVANLLRGNASRRGVESIKPQLAEHLGITEARVPKYLAEHCVVRWLQLDESASHFAHFVISVLRPTLNE